MIAEAMPNSTEIITTLTNETSLIGTASTREVVQFFVLLILAYVIGLVIAHYLKLKTSHKLKSDQLVLLTRFVRVFLILIVFCFSLPGLLDLSITILALICVALVAIIGLSSQNVISNMIGGLAMLYECPFKSGDFINTGEVSGTVISTRLFSVLIRTTSGVYVQIPNAQIYSSDVSNYFAHVARRYEYVVGIRYQDDVKKATAIITRILEGYTYVLVHPAPEVFVNDIDADSVRVMFRVWFPSVWARTKDDISLQTAILPRVKAALEAEGAVKRDGPAFTVEDVREALMALLPSRCEELKAEIYSYRPPPPVKIACPGVEAIRDDVSAVPSFAARNIDAALASVDIISRSLTWLNEDSLNAARAAVQRGVRVRVITFGHAEMISDARALADAGVQVRCHEYSDDARFMIVDGEFAAFALKEPPQVTKPAYFGLMIRDPGVCKMVLDRLFEPAWRDARVVEDYRL